MDQVLTAVDDRQVSAPWKSALTPRRAGRRMARPTEAAVSARRTAWYGSMAVILAVSIITRGLNGVRRHAFRLAALRLGFPVVVQSS
jgi:hypothetical protein